MTEIEQNLLSYCHDSPCSLASAWIRGTTVDYLHSENRNVAQSLQ